MSAHSPRISLLIREWPGEGGTGKIRVVVTNQRPRSRISKGFSPNWAWKSAKLEQRRRRNLYGGEGLRYQYHTRRYRPRIFCRRSHQTPRPSISQRWRLCDHCIHESMRRLSGTGRSTGNEAKKKEEIAQKQREKERQSITSEQGADSHRNRRRRL